MDSTAFHNNTSFDSFGSHEDYLTNIQTVPKTDPLTKNLQKGDSSVKKSMSAGVAHLSRSTPSFTPVEENEASTMRRKSRKFSSSSDLAVLGCKELENEMLDTLIQESKEKAENINTELFLLGLDTPFRKTEEVIFFQHNNLSTMMAPFLLTIHFLHILLLMKVIPKFQELNMHLKSHLLGNGALMIEGTDLQQTGVENFSFLANCMYYASSFAKNLKKIDFLQPTSLLSNGHKAYTTIEEELENSIHGGRKSELLCSLLRELPPSETKQCESSLNSVDDLMRTLNGQDDNDSLETFGSLYGNLKDYESSYETFNQNSQKELRIKPLQFLSNLATGLRNRPDVQKSTNIIPSVQYRDDSYACFEDDKTSNSQKAEDATIDETYVESENEIKPRSQYDAETDSPELQNDPYNDSFASSGPICEPFEYIAHITDAYNRTDANGCSSIVYVMEVEEPGNGPFRVEHQFSTFLELHLALIDGGIAIKSIFPQRSGPLSKFAPRNFENRRRIALDLWLNEVTGILAWGSVTGPLMRQCMSFFRKSDDFRGEITPSQPLGQAKWRRSFLLQFGRRGTSIIEEDSIDDCDQKDTYLSESDSEGFPEDEDDLSDEGTLLEPWPTAVPR